jgi:hypothetical protein
MHGIARQKLWGDAVDGTLIAGSFQCNAASNPLAATYRRGRYAPAWTVTYTATGIYTVQFPADFKLPALAQVIRAAAWPQWATLATDWFECAPVGEYDTANRRLVIQAHRNGVANAPAATAGNRINFALLLSQNDGK